MKQRKNITVGELLERLSNIEAVENQIFSHSVGLVKISNEDDPTDPVILGSGTFVQIKNFYGILTASHLIPDLIEYSDKFGLCYLSDRHSPTIKSNSVSVVKLEKPNVLSQEPDLAFILIVGSELDSIRATKSFWNLTRWKQSVLSKSIDVKNNIWVVSGYPAQNTIVQEASGGSEVTKCFQNLCGFSGVQNHYYKNQFDYLEISVLYLPGCDLPILFMGMSGGGVWQMEIRESENGILQATDPILMGVACWETNVRDAKEGLWAHTEAKEEKWIICHGPCSLYTELYNRVEKEYSH